MSKHVGKMLESSINGARKVLYKYVKIENRLISFTLYKNPFKIEQIPKCITRISETAAWGIKELWDIGIGIDILEMTPISQETIPRIYK